MSWYTRESLPDAGDGLLLVANAGEAGLSLSVGEQAELVARSSATLAAAGLCSGDRAVLSLAGEGDLAGPLLAQAVVAQGASAALVGPRGRMRLLATLRTLRPNVWITTPSGALDLLARLYLEFNVDPMELDLEHILVVGEIATPGTVRRLGDEFESEVTELYCEPFFGCALAHARGEAWQLDHGDALALAGLGSDTLLDRDPSARAPGRAELVVRPVWSQALAGAQLRTGQVVDAAGDPAGLFQHTVGEHLLVRGRWLSLPLLRRALALIDGTAAWRLDVSRGEGTLDKLQITLGFDRDTLVENPMWAGRAREAIAATTPIAFELEAERAPEGASGEQIADARGHHLGVDRAAVEAQ